MAASSAPGEGAGAGVERLSLYLDLEPDPVFAVIHVPAEPGPARAGVVLCPPFAAEETSTYRSYACWADELARAGIPALRFDLPGCGDSGGSPREAERFDAWLEALNAAASHLRETFTCERIVALGVGLGGTLACRAIADGAPIDDLILWAVPARGSAILREIRALAAIVESDPDVGWPAVVAADRDPQDLAGFLLPADVADALAALDLTTLTIPRAPARRVLMLGRDTLPADKRLLEQLERSGASVTVAAGTGYSEMVADPMLAKPPRETFATTIAWLEAAPPGAPAAATAAATGPVRTSATAELSIDGALIRETPITVLHEGRRMFGVIAEPCDRKAADAPLCAVLLTPSAGHRPGPRRMWTEAARRWAARGVPTVRIDLVGVGESDGEDLLYLSSDEFYRSELFGQVRATLDALEDRGFPGRFLLAGLCSSAYWSFHVALQDDRVCSTILMLRPASLFRGAHTLSRWEVELKLYARETLRLLSRGNVRELVRLARERERLARVGHGIVRRLLRRAGLRRRFPERGLVKAALARLNARGVSTLLLVEDGVEVDPALAAGGRADSSEPWPGVRLERLDYAHHVIGPVATQRAVHAAMDRALDTAVKRELELHGAQSGSAAA
jgi:pimeloyl-ACP methyl ester carboxylesterase